MGRLWNWRRCRPVVQMGFPDDGAVAIWAPDRRAAAGKPDVHRLMPGERFAGQDEGLGLATQGPQSTWQEGSK